MAEPKYFDFLDDDDIYKKITEIAYPYEVKEEINLARKKIGEGSYYRAGTVSREILESLIFEGLLKSNQLSNVEKDNIKAENLSKKINNLRNRNLISKEYNDIFHDIRKVGNVAVHNKKAMDQSAAIEALRLSDRSIRYLIKQKFDLHYSSQLPDDSKDSILIGNFYNVNSTQVSKKKENIKDIVSQKTRNIGIDSTSVIGAVGISKTSKVLGKIAKTSVNINKILHRSKMKSKEKELDNLINYYVKINQLIIKNSETLHNNKVLLMTNLDKINELFNRVETIPGDLELDIFKNNVNLRKYRQIINRFNQETEEKIYQSLPSNSDYFSPNIAISLLTTFEVDSTENIIAFLDKAETVYNLVNEIKNNKNKNIVYSVPEIEAIIVNFISQQKIMNERIEILITETFNLNSQVTRSQDDYEYTLLDDYSKMNNYQKSMLKSSMELMNKGVSLLLSPLI